MSEEKLKKKDEIKKIILKLRAKNDDSIKEFNNYNIHISISLKCRSGEIMEVNPYGINLRDGSYFGCDLIDGDYKNVRFW